MVDRDNKVCIRIKDEDKEIIARISKRFGDISVSAVVRLALREYEKRLFRGKSE